MKGLPRIKRKSLGF